LKLKDEVSYKHKADDEKKPIAKGERIDKKRERSINDIIRNIETTVSLFLYITEEGKISSDIGKLTGILGD